MLGVTPLTAIASFAAVSALFVLPTYPTLLAAVEMDDTGSTRIGKYVFNHAFLILGKRAQQSGHHHGNRHAELPGP
jgi:anaerobic C4-dicarboxylate transporter DcuA